MGFLSGNCQVKDIQSTYAKQECQESGVFLIQIEEMFLRQPENELHQ